MANSGWLSAKGATHMDDLLVMTDVTASTLEDCKTALLAAASIGSSTGEKADPLRASRRAELRITPIRSTAPSKHRWSSWRARAAQKFACRALIPKAAQFPMRTGSKCWTSPDSFVLPSRAWKRTAPRLRDVSASKPTRAQ